MASNPSNAPPDLLSKIKGPTPSDPQVLVKEIRRDLREADVIQYIDRVVPMPKDDIWKSQAENIDGFMKWYRARTVVQDYLLAKVSSWLCPYQCLEECGWNPNVIDPRDTYHKVIMASFKKNGQTEDDVRDGYTKDLDHGTFSTSEEVADCVQFHKDAAIAHGLFDKEEVDYIDDALSKIRHLTNLINMIAEISVLRSRGTVAWDDLIHKISAFGCFSTEGGDPRYYMSSITFNRVYLLEDSDSE